MVSDVLNSRLKARASFRAVSLRRGHGMLSDLAAFLGLRLDSSFKKPFSNRSFWHGRMGAASL